MERRLLAARLEVNASRASSVGEGFLPIGGPCDAGTVIKPLTNSVLAGHGTGSLPRLTLGDVRAVLSHPRLAVWGR